MCCVCVRAGNAIVVAVINQGLEVNHSVYPFIHLDNGRDLDNGRVLLVGQVHIDLKKVSLTTIVTQTTIPATVREGCKIRSVVTGIRMRQSSCPPIEIRTGAVSALPIVIRSGGVIETAGSCMKREAI
jgi:hypothetical protein